MHCQHMKHILNDQFLTDEIDENDNDCDDNEDNDESDDDCDEVKWPIQMDEDAVLSELPAFPLFDVLVRVKLTFS